MEALETWATRQATVAPSSGEAEIHAGGKVVAEVFVVRSVVSDLGWTVRPHLFVDASDGQGMAPRFLWLQQAVRSGALRFSKVWGRANPADALAKPRSHVESMRGLGFVAARSAKWTSSAIGLNLQDSADGGATEPHIRPFLSF